MPLVPKTSLPKKAANMHIPTKALISYSFLVSYVLSATISQAPFTPQWDWELVPAVVRFINVATGTALSANDSSADSAVVSTPVADNDARRWQVIAITRNLGIAIVNNASGKYLKITTGE
ncbi:MAG: hypothetical protein L6R40_005227, partial [Gallowayella cf. fulva]